ncbi:DUF3160 domain-containing protein [bacterium]|nr:DUF3160 domain-containing protein [bacterium]
MQFLSNIFKTSLLLIALAVCVACSCSGSAAAPTDDENQNQLAQDDQTPADDQNQLAQDDQTPAEDTEPTTTVDPEEPMEEITSSPVAFGEIARGFGGSYQEPAVKLPASFTDGPLALPIDLAGVRYLNTGNLSTAQAELLSTNGFCVRPQEYEEFSDFYAGYEYDDQPLFVTVDSVLHVYHLLFDKLLRDLEDEKFYSHLEQITTALAAAAKSEWASLENTELEESARHVWAYFAVAEQLLSANPPAIDAAIQDLVEPELKLIADHAGFAVSPVLTMDVQEAYREDYSQYVPRGHYTRTAQRQRYFLAMMWYGRLNMRLKVPAETRLALLITRLAQQTKTTRPVTELWAEIYDPTAFLVGNADDLGLREYSRVMRDVYGGDITLELIADDNLLAQFIQAARELPPPQINSMFYWEWEDATEETQGFRFMGQRFVLDAYVFQQLVHEKVYGRYMPNALDVMAALGNAEAYNILEAAGETKYAEYDSQMQKVRGEIEELTLDSWTQNVYFNWLYALAGVIPPKDECYPPYMRTAAWQRKDLQTALGSWTELKHDTILYAKQCYPAAGAAPPPEEIIWNYVEPNPLAYARLYALADLTQTGLAERDLLTETIGELLDSLKSKLVFLQGIAELELAGGQISEDDNWQLKYYGYWLSNIIEKSGDVAEPLDEYAMPEEGDEPAAIIADVCTDVNTGMTLDVATGRIFKIVVVTPDGYGGLQAAEGGVYSYYEFTWPLSDRLTDERWREMVENDQEPDRPAWTKAFIAE